jgi:iron(III) transport system substrate-binding protein
MPNTPWVVRIVILLTIVCATGCTPSQIPRQNDAARRLVIYSGRTEAFLTPVIDAFRTAYPDITVAIKYAKNTELAALLLAERSNPQADIFLTTDMLVPLRMIDSGVFAALPPRGSESVPVTLKDAQGRWTSVTSRARVIMYNTDMVPAADAPTSMLDLTDPRWRGKVAFADATNGPFQAHVAALMHLIGPEQTRAWVNGLVSNQTQFLSNATDLRMAVGSGEFAIGVANHYHYEVQRREAKDNHIGIVFPDQAAGQMGVVMNTSTVSQIAGAPHPDAAATFAAFLFQPDTQKLFADVNFEFPVLPGVTIESGTTQPDDFRMATVPMDDAADDADAAIQLMQHAGIP